MDYIITSFGCAIALLIYLLILLRNELLTESQKKGLILSVVIIIVGIILDTISLEIDGKFVNYIIFHKSLWIIEFIISPIIPALFAYTIARKSFWKKISKVFILLITINAIVQIINFWYPIVFSINKDAVYSRTQYTYGYLIVVGFCVILLFIASMNTYIQNTIQTSCTLLATALFVFYGVILRVFHISVNSDWLFITLGYFIFVIYFKDNYLKIDSTTKLLNRQTFDNKMESIKFTTAIVLIDSNCFKIINDNFGHRKGDKALRLIADAILNVYGKIGFCYRIGGDEFCVIVRKGVIDKIIDTEGEAEAEAFLKSYTEELNHEILKLHEAEREKNDKNEYLKYGVAQGFEIFDYQSALSLFSEKYYDKYLRRTKNQEQDSSNERKPILTIYDAFESADKKMYEDKAKKKATMKNLRKKNQ